MCERANDLFRMLCAARSARVDAERHGRLQALTEAHEFYEFDAVDEEHFDSWLHERIKEARRQLGIGNPAPTTTESATSPSAEAAGDAVTRA